MKVNAMTDEYVSSIVTPHKIKLWLETLQFFPTVSVLLDFNKGSDFSCSLSDFGSRKGDGIRKLDSVSQFTSGAIEQNSFTGTQFLFHLHGTIGKKVLLQKKADIYWGVGVACTIWAGYRH